MNEPAIGNAVTADQFCSWSTQKRKKGLCNKYPSTCHSTSKIFITNRTFLNSFLTFTSRRKFILIFRDIYNICAYIYVSYMHIWVCVCDVCTVCVCGYICPCVGAEARREHQVFCFTMGWGYRCLATPHFSYGYWDLKSCRTHTPLSYLFSPCF